MNIKIPEELLSQMKIPHSNPLPDTAEALAFKLSGGPTSNQIYEFLDQFSFSLYKKVLFVNQYNHLDECGKFNLLMDYGFYE